MRHTRTGSLSTGWRGAISAVILCLGSGLASAVTITVTSSPGNTSTIRASNATALQTEIDAAILRAGPTTLRLIKTHEFNPVTLKNKTSPADNAYITIESTGYADGTLPGPERRVSPSDAPNMAKIISGTGVNGTAGIRTQASAHHYILRGLEMVKADNLSFYGLVTLGSDAQTTLASIPHHITIDQCYLHEFDGNHEMFRCINLHSAHTVVKNCYLQGAKSMPTSGDSAAIGIWNTTGPFWIINNFLEGAAENFIVGGAGHVIEENISNPNIMQDITFKRNYCSKPLAWLPDVDLTTGFPMWTSSSARNFQVKNLFELKMGKRFDVQGNFFERSWGQYAGQEFAVVIKNTSNSTTCSQSELITHDVLFKYNKIKSAPGAIHTEGRVYSRQYPPELRRVSIEHNTFEDITPSATSNGAGWGYTTLGARGSFAYITHGGHDIRIQHNTCFNAAAGSTGGSFLELYSEAAPNFYSPVGLVVSNNVAQGAGSSTLQGTGGPGSVTGSNAITTYVTAGMGGFAHNAVKTSSTSGITGSHLSDNWWPTAWTPGSILVDQAAGNFNVVNPSVYWTNAAPGDLKPIGADLYTSATDSTSVNSMTANCVSGNWGDESDIVLYAKDATTKTSSWTVVADPLAAGEAYLSESNTGATQSTPLASPASYFELTFNAVANKPYKLWIRGRAPSNSTASDSVWVQFSNSLASVGGSAAYQIGSTSAMEWRLQNGSSDTISGWGWRDTKITGVTSEKQVIFSTTGPQTIRIQRFEDGPQIDQVLLSPSTYLGRGPVDANPEVAAAWSNPGAEDNDTTILLKTVTPAPLPPNASDDFAYTTSLNGGNGGIGFSPNAWTQWGTSTNPAITTGSLSYTDTSGNVLIVSGNKLQPAVNSRSYRNLPTANQFVPVAGDVLWASFRLNYTGTGALPSNHAGFALYSSLNADATGDEFFMGNPGFSGQNWGFNPEGGTRVVAPGDVSTGAPRNVFLLYKLVYTTTGANVSMWINPVITSEGSLGTPQATGTQPGLDPVRSVLISTGGTASGYQFDELRIGRTFTSVAPK